MACEEMSLYYAYLDAIEEEKRKAQPWQCEVTLFPQDGQLAPTGPSPAMPAAAKTGAAGFVCDEPE